jgi:hypothetical protein
MDNKPLKPYAVIEVAHYKYSSTDYFSKKFFDNMTDAIKYKDANNAVAVLEDNNRTEYVLYSLAEPKR